MTTATRNKASLENDDIRGLLYWIADGFDRITKTYSSHVVMH